MIPFSWMFSDFILMQYEVRNTNKISYRYFLSSLCICWQHFKNENKNSVGCTFLFVIRQSKFCVILWGLRNRGSWEIIQLNLQFNEINQLNLQFNESWGWRIFFRLLYQLQTQTKTVAKWANLSFIPKQIKYLIILLWLLQISVPFISNPCSMHIYE